MWYTNWPILPNKVNVWVHEAENIVMFQSMSAPLPCCPASRKWTPDPTLNKNSHDCSVMLFPVIQQATRYLKLQPVFLRKDVCALWAMLCRVMWNLFTVGSIQFSNDSTIASLEANQNRPKHCASSFLAMLSQTYLDNID